MGAGSHNVELRLGEERITVQVRNTRRRTLGLYVFPDGRVEIRVPHGTTRQQALAFAAERRAWLRDTLRELPEPPAIPLYEDGAVHPYLGDALTLRLRHRGRRHSRRDGSELHLTLPRPDEPEAVEQALRAWYRERARGVFEERLAHWFPALGLPLRQLPSLRIRAMRSRWGSCSSRGGVNLNLWLIRAPLPCIDYVVVHELCHLLEFNHGPRFYGHMDRILPDWRDRRQQLRDHQQKWG